MTNRAPMDLAEANKIKLNNSQLVILQSFFSATWGAQHPLRCIAAAHLSALRDAHTINSEYKKFNSINSNLKPLSALNPYWISGFTDAEGFFTVKIYQDKGRSFG